MTTPPTPDDVLVPGDPHVARPVPMVAGDGDARIRPRPASTASSTTSLPMVTDRALTDVVRRLTGRPGLAVAAWQTRPLRGGLSTNGGVYLLRGTGHDPDGAHPWSVVLKHVLPIVGAEDPAHDRYWRRELLVYGAGEEVLPLPADGLLAPRCLGADEDAGGYRLWLEHVEEDIERPWPHGCYRLAARHLGRFNGRFLTERPLPRQAWLATDRLRGKVERSGAGLARMTDLPDEPLVRRGWPPAQLTRMRALWGARAGLFGALATMPRVLCHGDANPMNIFMRAAPDGEMRTVAIDWSLAAIGVPGEDLPALLRSAIGQASIPPYPDLDAALFDGYLEGLAEVGWSGDPRLVRLAFAAAAALQYGVSPNYNFLEATTDAGRRRQLEEAFDTPLEIMLDRIVALRDYCLRLADEARALARAL